MFFFSRISALPKTKILPRSSIPAASFGVLVARPVLGGSFNRSGVARSARYGLVVGGSAAPGSSDLRFSRQDRSQSARAVHRRLRSVFVLARC